MLGGGKAENRHVFRPYAAIYETLGELSCCYYCGHIASTVDHVPPKTARDRLLSQGLRFNAVELPACQECNSALGNQALWTQTERKAYVKAWLRKRYRKVLTMPPWTEQEISELGERLQDYIRASLAHQADLRRRLSW